jgi:CubicO group peptidase (beta-lactamase class C family)
MKRLIVILLILGSPTSRGGDGVSELPVPAIHKQIEEYISSEIQTQKIPGLSLAVVLESKVVLAKGYGKASLELNAPSDPETLYGLGSLSKQFTAAAIMLLVQDRKMELSDNLGKFFAWTPNEWNDVTVRHLLTHTSGIRPEEWKGGIAEFDRFEHDQETVVRTAFGPLVSKPGEKFSYSNVGYRLLGMIIEKVSGQTYWNFLADKIFLPLGMNGTRNSDPSSVIPNRARGYARENGRYINREPVTASAAFSEGALISSVLDLVKWDGALREERLLTKASLEQIWSPVILNDQTTFPYGFGWFVRQIPGHQTLAHSGALPGFSSFIWRFLDDKVTVIVLANSENADTGKISLRVAGFYRPVLMSPEIKKQL